MHVQWLNVTCMHWLNVTCILTWNSRDLSGRDHFQLADRNSALSLRIWTKCAGTDLILVLLVLMFSVDATPFASGRVCKLLDQELTFL